MRIEKLRARKEWLAIVGLVVVTAGIWCGVLRNQHGVFRAVFLDVGQGDCVFVRTPGGRTVLVDGGGRKSEQSDGDAIGLRVVEPFLRREGVNRIDVLVLTHPHDDHVRGLIPVVRDFRVGMVLDSASPHGSESYRRFLSLVEARRISYRRAVRGQVIDFGDGVRAEVLNPAARPADRTDDLNENSVVLRFTYGESSMLLTGDAGKDAERDILASGANVRSDLLKIGHHGSDSGTSDDWLEAVRPKFAVISVGKNNPFGHPSRDVLDRLSARGGEVYRTDRDGAVVFEMAARRSTVYSQLARPVPGHQ